MSPNFEKCFSFTLLGEKPASVGHVTSCANMRTLYWPPLESRTLCKGHQLVSTSAHPATEREKKRLPQWPNHRYRKTTDLEDGVASRRLEKYQHSAQLAARYTCSRGVGKWAWLFQLAPACRAAAPEMDWVHCNVCFQQPASREDRFELTSCGHLLCSGCRQRGVGSKRRVPCPSF